MRAVVLLVLCSATIARADDPRDAFGFAKKTTTKTEQAEDCADGLGFGCVIATDPLAETHSIYGLSTWLPASYLLRLPVADATQEMVAHFAMGAGRDAAGPTFDGANGLENRWLIEGAPADNLRTGTADTRVPLVFLDGMYVLAGGFTARDRASIGGIIDTYLLRGTEEHELDARVFVGWTAPARQRAIAPASYFVRRGTLEVGPDASASLVATGPLGGLLGGTAWYAAGIAPELASTKFTWTTSTIVDRDNDGIPDGLPGVIETVPAGSFSRTPLTWRVPLMARAGLDRGIHHVDLTLVGTASNDVFYLYNSTLQAAGINGLSVVGDGIATWRMHWSDTHVRGQLAWHHSTRSESARDRQAAAMPQLLSAYVPAMLAEDPVLAATCTDDPATDPFPQVATCPVPVGWFASGGAGRLSTVTGDRPSITADVAHRIGNNVVRAGATGEDTRQVINTRYTGGTQIRSLFPSHMQYRRFADPNQTCHTDVGLPCPTVDKSELSYRTRYTAAYIEDTWQPDPRVAVDGGLRWELMWVGTALHYSDQVAPRLGASWDVLGKGRSRVWASMGRSFAMLPTGLGPTVIGNERYVDQIISGFGEGRAVETGAPLPVAPGIEPITQDQLTAGIEVALERTIRIKAWLWGNWVNHGIETVEGRFDNPGRAGGLAAVRESTTLAAEVALAPKQEIIVRIGFMYGRAFGSWTGPFDPRQGAILYAGSDYDARTTNLFGRLPTDMGHLAYIEGVRTGSIGSLSLYASTRLTVASGRPRNAIADSDEGIIYLLPRGSAGRGPLITQANLRLAAQWAGVDITLDLFNVFDQRDATAVDEVYAGGAVQPIDQGTPADLIFLKTDSGADATRRPTYGLATGFQSPFSAVLGVEKTF